MSSVGFYGVQFHPEVNHTEHGVDMIRNFLYEVCGADGRLDHGRLLQAAPSRPSGRRWATARSCWLCPAAWIPLLPPHCWLRQWAASSPASLWTTASCARTKGDEVEAAFAKWDLNFVRVDAEERFLTKLAGVSEPEKKRKIIGEEFIRVFEEEAKKIGTVDYLVQGTIYPDVIESGAGDAAVIKSHHNVGGLPEYVDFKEIIEPLRMLFKDEVRQLGRELGLPEYLVMRQPFPGPGLAIRIIGRHHQGEGWTSCGTLMPSSGRRVAKAGWDSRSASISPSSPICALWASWAMAVPMTTP